MAWWSRQDNTGWADVKEMAAGLKMVMSVEKSKEAKASAVDHGQRSGQLMVLSSEHAMPERCPHSTV